MGAFFVVFQLGLWIKITLTQATWSRELTEQGYVPHTSMQGIRGHLGGETCVWEMSHSPTQWIPVTAIGDPNRHCPSVLISGSCLPTTRGQWSHWASGELLYQDTFQVLENFRKAQSESDRAIDVQTSSGPGRLGLSFSFRVAVGCGGLRWVAVGCGGLRCLFVGWGFRGFYPESKFRLPTGRS